MKSNKLGLIDLQLFADEPNPTGGNTPTPNSQPNDGIDYKAMYEQASLEIEKQKKLKDDYAKENADYKRKLTEKMTDEEKNAIAQKELAEKYASMEVELNNMKLEKDILANGFSTDECEKLIKGNFSPKIIAEIIKVRIEANTASVKAELIKNTTPQSPQGGGTTTPPEKSDFVKRQEELAKKEITGRVEL